jgi:mRNA-degrading endonuclease RelE of RelBE toxin-antitoxin system
MHEIRWDDGARDDMMHLRLRAFEVRQIVDTVDEQLTYEPDRVSKRKKTIRPGESLPFEHLEPVWQLRVGEYRVFYDVVKLEQQEEPSERQEHQGVVSIRAVRHKPTHRTTGDIL